MQLIDTHTHLYLPEFDNDRDQVVERAVKNGIVKLLMPNIDIDSVYKMLETENRYPGICYSMIGLHPTSVGKDYLSQLARLQNLSANFRFYAVGEIGIDLYWDQTYFKEQVDAFKKQVEFALNAGLPVVIHVRNAFEETFEALEEFTDKGLKGVFHAFSGTVKDAEKAIKMGFKLGIGGVVTFKKSGLDTIVKAVGPENIVLETDSPYLAPVPHRGKRNESSFLRLVSKKVAEILNTTEEEIAAVTYLNSVQLFNL
ncbi:MAG: TatD family hydrolase [Bacteroidales bacterium]|nr:TatD family hydrolase [Bacteroidales bacterium]